MASIPPGDINTQPNSKVVFNAPYDDKHTYHIKIVNAGGRRIGWAIKTTNTKRLGVDPPCGVLDPKESVLMAVSCDSFDFASEDTQNDRITIEWTNTPDGVAKQFRREWFQGDGMKFSEEVPDEKRLPTLRHDKFMLEFYNAINEKQMIPLYCSLLKERRIIFTSKKLSQLSSCVFAAARLLYPFHWQNLFIPILPKDLVDMLMAPMPYMIGVPKQTFHNLNKAELGAVVVVDLEEKTFESPDVDTLPAEALNFLRTQLKSSSEMFLSDGLARSFLQTNVLIFGKYSLGFVKNGLSSDLLWDRQVFVDNQKSSLQPFLNSLIGREGVQYFERFIEERLKALNSGVLVEDEFDKEISSMNSIKIYDVYRNGHSSKPEVIHQAVNNVKENANEVIGALKDRVQAISIKEKLGRFTPTEVRRRKLHPAKSKKKIDPLSVDAAHYDFNNPLAATTAAALTNNTLSATNGDTQQSVSDAESVNSVLECDLIDFSSDFVPSPVPTPINSLNTSFAPSAAASATRVNNPTLDDFFGMDVSSSHLPSSSQQKSTARRTQWETFD